MLGGAALNVSFMVGLAFAVAASANFPALLLSLTWRRFNTTGAVVGVLFGVISSVALVVISPTVWPGPDSEGGALSWYSLANPGIISIPLGFIGCFLGTMLVREPAAEAKFDELKVRSETGLGAEAATGTTLDRAGTGRRRAAAAATATMVPPHVVPWYNLAHRDYERERDGRDHEGLRRPDRAGARAASRPGAVRAACRVP